MSKPVEDYPKRGHPARGKAPLVGVRISEEFQKAIRDWVIKQPDQLKLATAIRQLIALGLNVNPIRGASSKTATRANELAANVIDDQADPAASPEVQAERKRRLLKGPRQFPRRPQGSSKMRTYRVARIAAALMILSSSSPVAATEKCEAIKSIAARQACIDHQLGKNAAKRDPGVSDNPTMMDAVKKLKQEDDRLTAKLHGICRGC